LKKQLAGAPGVLELPADRIRPAVQTYRGATETALFPTDLLAELREISAAEGATLFMTLLPPTKRSSSDTPDRTMSWWEHRLRIVPAQRSKI
jgi:hypothetical protein